MLDMTMLDKNTTIIRPATGKELSDLSVMIARAFETYRGTITDRALFEYIALSADLEQHKGHGDIMVLESAGKVVGSVVYYPKAGDEGLGLPAGWAGIRTLAVHPSARGRGFGRSLIEYCIDRARREGHETVGLHTADFMKDAVALYQALSFGRCPQYDLWASDILNIDLGRGDILVTAFKRTL
ncbi:GNAT family N-acetyltransferase [Mesorhizobium sp. YC-39]|uniref:GNAT family N-acetyltransferase n=1 Tax=unclassified Mesorhizobium TaxID=325217 RepID=UPI0021E7234D|nr:MULTISPECIES: GNAT family N-acetyltransferase [unclassified Mesorhizobium]MCV3209332.1 GNAT family N-acetyltransferase [Mesorhizobium sp. YC-2]MCV3231318.1 GNAT family N-acetyltransferase [Mesorhizobium sp. YC-39]